MLYVTGAVLDRDNSDQGLDKDPAIICGEHDIDIKILLY